MIDNLVTTAYVVASLTFLIAGIVAVLLPPEKYNILLKQFGVTGPAARGKNRRGAGVVLILMGMLFLSSIKVVNWLAFGLGVGVLCFGIFILIWPSLLSWFSDRFFQQESVPDRKLRIWNIVMRVMGAVMIYASTDLFRVSMGR